MTIHKITVRILAELGSRTVSRGGTLLDVRGLPS